MLTALHLSPRVPRLTVAILFAWSSLALAGYKKPALDSKTPEGQFLDLVELEADSGRKRALLEQFVTMFPNSKAALWVYEQLQAVWRDAGNIDKELQCGDRILALDPTNIELAYTLSKTAEKKDPALGKKYSDRVKEIVGKLNSSTAPADPEQLETWKQRVEFAKQFNTSAEFKLYNQAVQAQDPRKRVEFLDQLIAQYPKTQFAGQVRLMYFLAYKQSGDTSKALAAAEAILEREQTHLDVLLFVADNYFRRKKDLGKVTAYLHKILELVESKAKPAGLSDAEWSQQKALYSAHSWYMIGATHLENSQFAAADRALRAALPNIRGNENLRAVVLSSLGWVNYKMDNVKDAIQFYTQCMAINSQYREQAAKNINSIKTEKNLPDE